MVIGNKEFPRMLTFSALLTEYGRNADKSSYCKMLINLAVTHL